MRKLFLLVLITTVMLGVMMVPAHGAEAIVSSDLYGDLVGIYNATYESTLSMLPDNMTYFASGYFYNWGYGGYTLSGFGIGAGVDYYFGEVMEGFYAYGGLSYISWSTNFSGYGFDFPAFGFMAGVGYKYYLSDQWVVDGKVGLGSSMFGAGIGYVLK